jgi:hypothetical protein
MPTLLLTPGAMTAHSALNVTCQLYTKTARWEASAQLGKNKKPKRKTLTAKLRLFCCELSKPDSILLSSTLLYTIQRTLHPCNACAFLFGNVSLALTRTVTSTDDPSFYSTLLYAIRHTLHPCDPCARPFGNASPVLTRTVTSTDDPSFNSTLLYAIRRALSPRVSRFSLSRLSLSRLSLS